MLGDTLCPAVEILGTCNAHNKAKGIADHYCPVFLDGSTHLYMRVCPSVGRSVRRSVGWMVRNLFFFLNVDGHNSRKNDGYNDYTDV